MTQQWTSSHGSWSFAGRFRSLADSLLGTGAYAHGAPNVSYGHWSQFSPAPPDTLTFGIDELRTAQSLDACRLRLYELISEVTVE